MLALRWTLLFFAFLTSSFSWGYGNFLNSSKILKRGEYDLSSYGHFFQTERSGAITTLALDLPLTKDSNIRLHGGVGSFDFTMGASLKTIMFSQRKIPFNGGLVFSAEYGRDDTLDAFLFRASPFISRNFSWEFGTFEPYLSVPVGISTADSKSSVSSQFITGMNIRFSDVTYMSFAVEGGFKIKNSEAYLGIMATLQLKN